MPAYVTYQDVKEHLIDTLPPTIRDYDVLLRRLAERASRMIERLTGRSFFAKKKTWYDTVSMSTDCWYIPDCLGISTIKMSGDDGETYAYTLAPTDYLLYGGADLEYDTTPYRLLRLAVNGDYGVFYQGQNALQVVGLFGWHDDFNTAWENSLDTIEDNPLQSTASTITVNDADGVDLWGVGSRFKVGQVLRLGTDEQCELTNIDPATNQLTVIRAIHGTTAPTTTAQNTAIYIYRTPQIIQLATAIQTARWFKRGQQAFQNASSNSGFGQMIFVQRFDPEIMVMLWDAGLRRISV